MRIISHIIVFTFFVLLLSCNPTKHPKSIEVSLRLYEPDSCHFYCYFVEITVKNNTDKKCYLPFFQLPNYIKILDTLNNNIYKRYSDNELDFIRYNGRLSMLDSGLHLFENNIYSKVTEKDSIFRKEAIRIEKERFYEMNKSIKDKIADFRISWILDKKYKYPLLLEPGETYKEIENINTLFHLRGRYKIVFDYPQENDTFIIGPNMKKENKLVSDTLYYRYNPVPPDKILDYYYINERLISDTLYIDSRNVKLKFDKRINPITPDSR